MAQCFHCTSLATHLYTWPGESTKAICFHHLREITRQDTTPLSELVIRAIPLELAERAIAADERKTAFAEERAIAAEKRKAAIQDQG